MPTAWRARSVTGAPDGTTAPGWSSPSLSARCNKLVSRALSVLRATRTPSLSARSTYSSRAPAGDWRGDAATGAPGCSGADAGLEGSRARITDDVLSDVRTPQQRCRRAGQRAPRAGRPSRRARPGRRRPRRRNPHRSVASMRRRGSSARDRAQHHAGGRRVWPRVALAGRRWARVAVPRPRTERVGTMAAGEHSRAGTLTPCRCAEAQTATASSPWDDRPHSASPPALVVPALPPERS